ncbi:efflux RND transporter permease subunit [Sulfurimonas sp. HSL1-2]|uniref:efflux RND transporter permease subunit n=1 Tax=Thiomicrolovo zhangzhouensis TaxID=3131933 RepID=UPI0031F8C3DB
MTSNSFTERLLRRPYFIYSFLVLFVFLGLVGYGKLDRKLFPDSNYPEIAVVIASPGTSAEDMAANIAVPAERKFYTIDNVRRVYSSTIDEVTVIRAEFEYDKDLDDALNDVSAAFSKIRAVLPTSIQDPQFIKITAATAPIVTYALHSKDDTIPLEEIRRLAERTIKNRLLKLPGVANVDLFGGHEKSVRISLDRHKMERFGLKLDSVIGALKSNDADFAIGFLQNEETRYLLRSSGQREEVESLKALPISANISLGDIAEINFGHGDNRALYYGNGNAAIALAVQRNENADVIAAIETVEREMQKIAIEFTNLQISVTDTQKDTIVQSTTNMFESLRDAIILSTLVVFLFLGSFRQILVVMATIPLVYASTVALMWLVGIEINVVTMTAIILALGLLLDDTVVVMENIERHFKTLHDTIDQAVITGTKEIMFADLSGTITTMIALSPMLFVGGYPQTVFQPLVGTLLLALVASYIISITAVPLLSLKILAIKHPRLERSEAIFNRFIMRFNDHVQYFFASAVKLALRSKLAAIGYVIVLVLLFIISARGVMPTVGRELMPPMDTGALKVNMIMDANLPIEKSEAVIQRVNTILESSGELRYLSASIGSEAGVLSIGSGGSEDQLSVTATYVDRFHREENIWEIARLIRSKLQKLPDVKQFDVVDFGATALANIRANVDVTLFSDDLNALVQAGDLVAKALYQTQGLVSVSKTWERDKKVFDLKLDERKAHYYGTDREQIASQLQSQIYGSALASVPESNIEDLTVWIQLKPHQRASSIQLASWIIDTPKGKIPLGAVAEVTEHIGPSLITREGLQYTLNIYGYREKAAISHIMDSLEAALMKITLPEGVTMEQSGDIKQFKDSAGRMVVAIGFAVILILLTLVVLFESLKLSFIVVLSIPLTIIGASWMMLLMHYHTSMPAMMGFILLSGVIVNNAILLIHFAKERMMAGMNAAEAMLESIRIRTRPVLMTAFAVSAGMLPIAVGNAIGLERLAPLGAVAIGGLIVGTFLTLLFIPLVFIWTQSKKAQG